jgi:3'-phosphoadenosine 5'-phosphosulfate (PAPS) 3'-phosphatase
MEPGDLTDAELARDLAAEAGALLLHIQSECAGGDRGDREANALILERLRAARPEDAILSEESADDLARLARSRVWIVDPLDGTREFAERRGDWAVHVALAIDGRAAIGAFALPRLGLTLSSDAPPPCPNRMRLRGCWSAGRGRAPCASTSRIGSAPRLSAWARRVQKRWPWCAARPRSISIPAARTNGTIAPRSR